jgi:hypothetical protein
MDPLMNPLRTKARIHCDLCGGIETLGVFDGFPPSAYLDALSTRWLHVIPGLDLCPACFAVSLTAAAAFFTRSES